MFVRSSRLAMSSRYVREVCSRVAPCSRSVRPKRVRCIMSCPRFVRARVFVMLWVRLALRARADFSLECSILSTLARKDACNTEGGREVTKTVRKEKRPKTLS